jgi:hypothetical protein
VTEGGGDGPRWYERALYRVVYAEADRPRFLLGDGTTGVVVDCSESGVRYRPDPRQPLPAFGAIVEGRIAFRAGAATAIAGRVIRVARGEVALYLSPPGIPLRVIFAEQLALRARYSLAEGEAPGDGGPARRGKG